MKLESSLIRTIVPEVRGVPMARNTRSIAVEPPTHTSSHAPKPTEKAPKKRSCSISTTSTSTAKKAKSKLVSPPRSPLPLTPPRPLVSTVSPTPPRSAQPNVEEEDEVKEEEQEEEDDDDVEELPLPAPVRFMSVEGNTPWYSVSGLD